jgi:hypothetical protein
MAHLSEQSRQLLDESQDPKWEHQHIVSGNRVRLVLQVRAFLEASEEVDIDAETLEDLIQAINQDDDSSDIKSSDGDHHAEGHLDSDTTEEEIDVSALYTIEDEGNGRSISIRLDKSVHLGSKHKKRGLSKK